MWSESALVENGPCLLSPSFPPLAYPLFPTPQGILWIKEREAKNNLKVLRMGAPGTVTAMERAIEAGNSVLVENMGEGYGPKAPHFLSRCITFHHSLANILIHGS